MRQQWIRHALDLRTPPSLDLSAVAVGLIGIKLLEYRETLSKTAAGVKTCNIAFHTTKSTRFPCLILSFLLLTGRYKILSETVPLSTRPRPRFPIFWDNVGYFMATRGRGRTINCIISSELQPFTGDLGLVWAICLHIQTIFFDPLTFTLSHKSSLNFRWGWARRFWVG